LPCRSRIHARAWIETYPLDALRETLRVARAFMRGRGLKRRPFDLERAGDASLAHSCAGVD
jgi:hypothetical protein